MKFVLILMVAVGVDWGQAVEAVAARRVLLVSCDGLRPDAIPMGTTPVMQRLMDSGSYQLTASAELPPVTLPNHTSMVTGRSVPHHGVFFNVGMTGRVSSQTIFDVAKAANLSVGFFANKGKLSFLCEEGSVDAWRIVGGVDELTTEVVNAVGAMDLRLMFVHFGEPDGAGHREGWMSEPYLTQIGRVDAALGRILDALEAKGVLDETLVIVTADHGGHDKTHFLNIPEDRRIPFILNGPGIAEGRVLCEQVRTMDAAATALDFLGLPTDVAADGKVVREAAVDFVQPECVEPIPTLDLSCGPVPILLLAPMMVGIILRGRRHRREAVEPKQSQAL